MKSLYEDKAPEYYGSVRQEILPLLPVAPRNVLEVGCGTGATLAWLRQIRGCLETTGIELVSTAAEQARGVVDHVIVADIENDRIVLPGNHFDLIVCLDVLEHLRDPWSVLNSLVAWLSDGGCLVASVPNLRYRTVVCDLFFRGKFAYENVGILDRTHLRFFTQTSAVSLLESAGLVEVQSLLHPHTVKGVMSLVNVLTFGYFRDMFSWQILLSGRKLSVEEGFF